MQTSLCSSNIKPKDKQIMVSDRKIAPNLSLLILFAYKGKGILPI